MDAIAYALALKIHLENENAWVEKGNIGYETRELGGAAAVDGKIYHIGGAKYESGSWTTVRTNMMYDISTGQWTAKALMPIARENLAVTAVNGKIYAIGGYTTSLTNRNEEYDPSTNTWTAKADMPTARGALGAGASDTVNGKIYVIGGGGTGALDNNEEYDPSTNTWTAKAVLPTARASLTVAASGGKLYAIGGYTGSEVASNLNQEYNPVTNTWTTKVAMPTARFDCNKGVLYVNGKEKIYIVAGHNGNNYYTATQEYDPATNTWTPRGDCIAAVADFAAAVVNNRLYVIDGQQSGDLKAGVREYTPVSDRIVGLKPLLGYLAAE